MKRKHRRTATPEWLKDFGSEHAGCVANGNVSEVQMLSARKLERYILYSSMRSGNKNDIRARWNS
jgi:hypothetical protein